MTHRIKHLIRLTALVSAVVAGAATAAEPVAMLPVGGLSFIERPGKQPPALVAANGRYVVTVALYDRWTGRIIATPEQASWAATHLDLDAIGLHVADLAPITIGDGPDQVVVFLDPLNKDSQTLVRTIVESATLRTRYNIQLLAVPMGNNSSAAIVQRLACTDDRQQAVEALAEGNYSVLPNTKLCAGTEGLQRRIATAVLLGVTGVPYLISPDGRVQAGLPDDLAQWLAGGDP